MTQNEWNVALPRLQRWRMLAVRSSLEPKDVVHCSSFLSVVGLHGLKLPDESV